MMIGCSKTGNAKDRPAYNAGMFYPKDPQELRADINSYLADAGQAVISQKPFGLISPHAGTPYSGPVAAYGYTLVRDQKYEAVVIVAPCHVDYFSFASIYDGDAYRTPLGRVPVAKALAQELVSENRLIQFSSRGHVVSSMSGRADQSIEVQVPFLQIVLKDTPIIPIIIGSMDWAVLENLGQQLGKFVQQHDVLIIASSDLSHYHSYKECQNIDQKFIKLLEKQDVNELYQALTSQEIEACGGGPILTLLIAAQANQATTIKTLKYANSGDVPFGDKSRVVGYLSAAIYKSNNPKSNNPKPNEQLKSGYLDRSEQMFLLDLAENVIQACVKGKPIPKPTNIPPICQEKRGAFVTIEKHGQLRGCIGYILPMYPLYETVIEVAQSAALKDPRFDPVQPKELPDLEIEISVLTVPEKISDPSTIEVGKHGIIMKRGFYQGLLLPQVATDYGWDRETFLEHTCLKAGLPRDAWKDKNTEISIFSAQVFNRETLK